MTLYKKARPFSLWLHSMVLGLTLLLGAETVGAQIRTVLVSPVPGNPVASGTALRNALAGISSPSSSNPWLLKIEPGIYDVGTISLQMRSWVDIEGSGIGVTTIRGSAADFNATINGANNAELRLLTVEAALGSAALPGPIAMANYSASPRLYRVKFSASGGAGGSTGIAYGVRNRDSTPLIEECEIKVVGSGDTAYGLVFGTDTSSPLVDRSSILRSKVTVSGSKYNYGLYMAGRQYVSEIRDSRIDVVGGVTTRGIHAVSDSSWSGQENLRIRNTEIISGGGSSASYGISIQDSAWISLDINGSKVWGHSSPTTYGIVQGWFGPVGTQWSHIVGFTQTVQTVGSASIQSTYLQGGPVTAGGWLGCMGVWEENGIFYANSCP